MLTAQAPAATPEVRNAVSRLAARYFVLHLEAELRKPDEVLLEDYKDLPVRQITHGILNRVRLEFNIAEEEKLPPENLFKRWCEINGMFGYEDSAFIGYNQIFLPRLLDLRDGTPESQRRVLKRHYRHVRPLRLREAGLHRVLLPELRKHHARVAA